MNQMYNNDNFIAGVLFLIAMFGFAACYDSPSDEEKAQQERGAEHKCYSKASGSSPRCWTDADWSAYCSRVQCK